MDKIIKEMRKPITIQVFRSPRCFEEQIKNHPILFNSSRKVTMRNLIKKLQILTAETALVSANNTTVDEKYMIKAGDVISLYSPIRGS